MGITRHYILPLSWLDLLYIAEYDTLYLLLKNINPSKWDDAKLI